LTIESEFYTLLFTEDPAWSTPYPNYDEALRWGKLSPFLSQIAHQNRGPLRILDLGCGRGWMTYLASQYGTCDAVDPVAPVVEFAKTRYPGLEFLVGSVDTVLSRADFRPYDVVLCSEVIEHIPDTVKQDFVRGLRSLLVPSGHLLITTPRGEWLQRWSRMKSRMNDEVQPVEAWVTERNLLRLISSHGFVPVRHDRVYFPFPRMSFLHLLCASRRFAKLLSLIHFDWFLVGLRYVAAFYQVWWFRANETC
jgi:SAM-dependent methyltransferase